MAATGGGKIRTRRYHIVSKPYAKGKQQPGLISRVTDTVKSIVPSWLQSYFKNGEVAEGGEVQDEVVQNNVAAPPNGSQDAVHLPDGCNSPGLPSTSTAEPSTSRASLNFQDALSRPPLNRSHLHFPSQDGSPVGHLGGSSSLFLLPSTSTAPFPGNPFAVGSNFSLVKDIKDSSSQHEDDNISTTSGFSSRASDKDVPTSKSAPLLWSPETERTHSGSQLAHTSLKKPAFNLSVFGTSSSSTMNNSSLNSSQLGDSPFYPGKTTYGGAAAVKTARARPGTPYQAPVRRQIKAKPAGAQPCGVTSATARRILQSLERMSSPLADAKRIPSTVSSPLSTSLNHSDPDCSAMQSKRKRLETALPPVQKLVIPAAAAVSGNRSISFRPSLTPGFVSKAVEKGTNETPVRRLPQIPDAVPSAPASTSSLSYPMSSTPASSNAGGGKMKRERTLRPSSKRPDQEVSELPHLPPVSLPISKASLPTFTFSSTPPTSLLAASTSPKSCVSAKSAIRKESMAVSTPFTFASPIFKATSTSPSFSPSTSLQSEFTFSEPTVKTTSLVSNGKLTPELRESTVSKKEEEFEGPFKPAKELKQGSVLDILRGPGFAASAQNSSSSETTKTTPSMTPASVLPVSGFGDRFKPAAGSWDCDSCLVRNKSSDKTCAACRAPQPSTDSSSKADSKPAKAPAASLATLFAPPAGSWDCDTCLVRNKPEVFKCVACDTAKPGTGVKPALTLPPISKASSTLSAPPASSAPAITSSTSGLLGFGDKFKKPAGAWDCDVCMVQNKEQDKTCVSCMSAKPGAAVAPSSQAPASTPVNSAPLLGFGDKFKKPEGSWECDVCCVQNKAEDQQCVACQSAKPGAKTESKGFGTFGTQSSSTESSSSDFKFGTSSSSSVSGGLKFGGTFSDSSTISIKFGNASTDTTSPASFKFGGALTEPALDKDSSLKFGGSVGGFKFGAANTLVLTAEEKKGESLNTSAGFKFGEGSGIAFGSGATSSATTTSSGGFSFGLTKPEEKTESSLAFSFSAPKAKAEKQDTLNSTETVSAAPTPANSIPVFGKPPVTEPPTAVPSFGEPATKEAMPATATTFMFGKTEEKESSVASTGFLFSGAKEADKPAPSLGFSFTQPDPPKEPPKPTFSFGKPAEPTETAKPVFSFGQNASDAAAPKPTFGFMGSSSSAPAASNSAPSLFGTSSSTSLNPTPAPTNAFVFGQNASSDAPPPKTFMFGQQQDGQAAPGEPSAAPAPQAPFVFGSGTNSTSSSFSFGNAASTPASAAPGPPATPYSFGFTSNTSTTGFGSGQTSAFGSSQPSVPTFGAAAPSFTASTPAAPAFGTKPSAAPVFGQQPNATPSFGSATASAGQGFQFGGSSSFGASNNSSSSSSSGVFTFGGGPGTTAGPTASPAMTSQPAAPGGGFNFTPNFNIGSAKNSFNTTPTGQHVISGRKIKTAVRRRK